MTTEPDPGAAPSYCGNCGAANDIAQPNLRRLPPPGNPAANANRRPPARLHPLLPQLRHRRPLGRGPHLPPLRHDPAMPPALQRSRRPLPSTAPPPRPPPQAPRQPTAADEPAAPAAPPQPPTPNTAPTAAGP